MADAIDEIETTIAKRYAPGNEDGAVLGAPY
jgi:hypothetical protein